MNISKIHDIESRIQSAMPFDLRLVLIFTLLSIIFVLVPPFNHTPIRIPLALPLLLFILQEFFGEIVIPKEVWREVVERGKGKVGSEVIEKAEWIKVQEVGDDLSVEVLCREIERGEVEAIILAKRINAEILIMDEKIPREIAGGIGLKVVGSLALIHEGIERGLVNQTLDEITKTMRGRGIWISDEVIIRIKKKKGFGITEKGDCGLSWSD